jgi:FAD-dependent oxidoreductase family protein
VIVTIASLNSRGVVSEIGREVAVAHRCDVAVVGGGSAGVIAAIAAARGGARTLLVERYGSLGGTMSLGGMAMVYTPFRVLHGLALELMQALVDLGAAIPGELVPFDPEYYKIVALELIERAGVVPLLYTYAAGVITEEGAVRGVLVESKAGRQAVVAKCVIDASGDADLAVWAGAPTVKGRESDGKMRPISLLFRLGGVDMAELLAYVRTHPDQFSPDPNKTLLDDQADFYRIQGFFGLVEEAKTTGTIDPDLHYIRLECGSMRRGMIMVNTTRVYDVDGTRPEDLARAEIKARRQMVQVIRLLREKIPGFQRTFLLDTAAQLGVRETRRIRGEYVLSEEDIAAGRVFEDSIARGYKRLTPGGVVHSPDKEEGGATDRRARSLVEELHGYTIPYRVLVPLKAEGLLVAGRCISVTHGADAWTRDQNIAMFTGQAAGTAAILSVELNVSPRLCSVKALQERLLRNGVRIS